MRPLRPFALAALLASGSLVACGSGTDPASPGDPATDLATRLAATVVGPQWLLAAFVDGGVETPVVAGTRVTLQFGEGTAAGSAGCNRYHGAWSVTEAGQLQVGPLAATKMACAASGVMAQERRFLGALAAAREVVRGGDTLRLADEGGVRLRLALDAGTSAAPGSTIGVGWRLEQFEERDGDGVVHATPALAGTAVTARFDAGGSASGSTGCNAWGGRWEAGRDGQMRLDSLVSTEKACLEPPGAMAQEAEFLGRLAQVARWESGPGWLRLATADGDRALEFAATDSAGAPGPAPAGQDSVRLAGGGLLRYRVGTCEASLRGATEPEVRGEAGGLAFRYRLETFCTIGSEGTLEVVPVVDGPRILLTALYRGPLVRCTCPIPVTGSISGLAAGTYSVTLEHTYEVDGQAQPPRVVDSRRVRVGGSDPGAEVAAIRGGASFGLCRGYCWNEVQVDAGRVVLTSRSWDPETDPERRLERPAGAAWPRLLGPVDLPSFADLDESYGCPDCADGGAEWVEVAGAAEVRRVTFEHGDPPPAIAELAGALRGLREQMQIRPDSAASG